MIRTLVHDKGKSRSLLGQLGAKDTISFRDTAEPLDPRNLAPTMGLVQARIDYAPAGTVGSYEAPLAGDPPKKKRAPHSRSRKRSRKRGKSRPAKRSSLSDVLVVRGVSVVEGGPENLPREEPPPHAGKKLFDEWWADPVTKDSHGSVFARRDYVLAGANKVHSREVTCMPESV